jgi:hypothetical protein
MKTFTAAFLLLLSSLLLVSAKSDSLPPPVGKEKLTFAQIEAQKDELKDKIVLLEIDKLLGEGSDFGHGLMRYIAKDTSGSPTAYGQVVFPKEGLKKLRLDEKPGKGPFTVYVRVHVFGGKAAALSEAVGTHFAANGEKNGTYNW